jgi:hypothetical protein
MDVFLEIFPQEVINHIHDIEDLPIFHAEENPYSILSTGQKVGLLHNGKVFGDVGLFPIDGGIDFADTFLPLPEEFQYFQPRWLGKGLENFRL